jgi:diaminopimelate decarboxylase
MIPARMHFSHGLLQIGDISAIDLVSRFGTPLYVYDAAVIRRQVERVRRAFSTLPLQPFFAMKANSNLAILRLVHEHGFGLDAVSPGEIHIARSAGYSGSEIWFTCSNVSDDDLLAIDDPTIIINVNSMSEVDRILRLELANPIALRVNTDIGAGHHADVVTAGGGVKFGIDLAEIEAARNVVEDSGRRVVGLHAHIGSGVDQVAPLAESARRLVEISPTFPNLRFLNFGGGLAVPYRPGDAEFPIDEYGAQLAAIAAKTLRDRGLTAILEPGRYVVAESGVLLSRVTAKRVSGGLTWLGVDTGFNHLVRPSKYGAYHHIVNASRGTDKSLRDHFDSASATEEVIVAGNLCESGDVFTRNSEGVLVPRAIDRTRVDDIVAFCDAGAYGFSMGSHYNARLLPAEVLVDNGEARLVRHRQSYRDLVRGME